MQKRGTLYLNPDVPPGFQPLIEETLNQSDFIETEEMGQGGIAVFETGITFEEELATCPDCDSDVVLDGPIESNGDGTALGLLRCQNPDCDFVGQEEWVHDQTVRAE